LRQPRGVIGIADENSAGRGLLLEMALQTKGGVALGQHALIDRAVRRVAAHTTLAQRLVFKDERSALRSVTLEAGSILTK
jgi:hypothetical protein